MSVHIGIDFDNTIAIYDKIFYRHAIALHAMPEDVYPDKPSIRAYYWGRPGGREDWIELQGIVYGTKMREAAVAPGFLDFARWVASRNLEISIISHKTEYPAGGPRVSLHEAAWEWLEGNGFFDGDGVGIDRGAVFFESERDGKLARIFARGCGVFIDDLPEIFAEPDFPSRVRAILYDPADRHDPPAGGDKCASWTAIAELVGALAEGEGR
ncbi:MAG: HAD family hydrolase [Candidatus Latescibacterota bacterium]|nr:HAD family hydrolase [Candidatus Latescibacterota bacterium]